MVYNYTRPRGPIAAMYSSPGPAQYGLPSLVGQRGHDPRSIKERKAAWHFGTKHFDYDSKSRSPGPVYNPNNKITRFGRNGEPQYSLYGRAKDLKQYSYPPPGAYSPEKSGQMASPRAPAYTFGDRHKLRSVDKVPAPNTYSLPPLVGDKSVEGDKKRAPAYSMKGRSRIGGFDEDMAKTPGPSAYPGTSPSIYKRRDPAFSMTARNSMPGDNTLKPGPGAHNLNLYADKKQSPRFSFGIRHSEYSMPVVDPILVD